MITGNNEKFLRLWFEINKNNIRFNNTESDLKYWVPYNKGGKYKKWYGNQNYVANWKNAGVDFTRNRNTNSKYYFKSYISWSYIGSTTFCGRFFPEGFIWDVSGSGLFPFIQRNKYSILGLLCSPVSPYLLKIINPTSNFQVENLLSIPFIKDLTNTNNQIEKIVNIALKDWNSYETSWDFTTLPLLDNEHKSNLISGTYNNIRSNWNKMTLEMQRLEEENNKIFIGAYGLEDELTPEVPLKEITLTCNPYYRYCNNKTTEELEVLLLEDTMKEYISYAVGCMFCRYSIDKPGLILANQGETYEDYCKSVPNSSFSADEDNVIPILDDEWFSDDIVYRFKDFVRASFGEENYYENIRFIEDSIGKDMRTYFLKDFYNDHVKRYTKRPIYWMFSSSDGGFNALIYMHRYKSDTVGIVRSNYLLEYISKITTKIEHLERNQFNINLSNSEKTKALKEVTVLKRRVDELKKYERDTMFPLAAKKIEIDLDDGVKVNYLKFGKALKNVTGLSAK